jgi:hypothetical protein
MNAPATIKPDEITTFLGLIPAEEYERRAKLRSYRNAASALIARTPSDTARYLAWEVIEWATPNLYAPAPLEWLDQLNVLAKRLMVTAMQAEQMHAMLMEAARDD